MILFLAFAAVFFRHFLCGGITHHDAKAGRDSLVVILESGVDFKSNHRAVRAHDIEVGQPRGVSRLIDIGKNLLEIVGNVRRDQFAIALADELLAWHAKHAAGRIVGKSDPAGKILFQVGLCCDIQNGLIALFGLFELFL